MMKFVKESSATERLRGLGVESRVLEEESVGFVGNGFAVVSAWDETMLSYRS